MRYVLAVVLLGVFFASLSPLLSADIGASMLSHRLNTSELGFLLDQDSSRVRFASNYIYLGDETNLWSYINDDTLRFYNLQMDSGSLLSSWTVTLSGPANLTITKLFLGRIFEADVTAATDVTSTTKISCAQPLTVEGPDSYSWANNILTMTSTHASTVHLKVVFPDSQSAAVSRVKTMIYQALTITALGTVTFAAALVFLALSGKLVVSKEMTIGLLYFIVTIALVLLVFSAFERVL